MVSQGTVGSVGGRAELRGCPDPPLSPPPPGVVEPVDVSDNGDGTQRVSYVPSREGPYSISVRYGDEEVPRR